MADARLTRLLDFARVPREIRPIDDLPMLRITVRNTMLSLVEKMSIRELMTHLNRLRWVTFDHSRDSMKEALRFWILHPQAQIFRRRRYEDDLIGRHLTDRLIVNMPFFLNHEIKKMTEAQLTDALVKRGQSIRGDRSMLVERLM